MTYITSIVETPLGNMLAQASGEGLSGLWFWGQRYFLADWEKMSRQDNAEVFIQLKIQLAEYFHGRRKTFTLALQPEGTPYRRRVWRHLMEIEAGQVVSYGDIARKMNHAGGATSPRAVGGAVGHNPISILIPCHRVVGAGGGLTGYAGGIERKRALLDLEQGVSRLF